MTQPDKEGEQPEKENYVQKVLRGLAPCHAPNKSYLDVIYGLKSALIFANNLPQGAALTGQLCDIANLIWDYERMRLRDQASGGEDKQDELWEEVHYAFQALSPQEVINHLNKEYIIQKRKP